MKETRQKAFADVLKDIEKRIASKQTDVFNAGQNGLQEYRARVVQSCLMMMLKGDQKMIDASWHAAEAQGFVHDWGGRLVHQWVRQWVKDRTLPESSRGHHIKSFSLLNDPAIATELRTYVCSNKWAMNPKKLTEFSKNTMVPAAAKQYLQNMLEKEIPRGLKSYLELVLFPRIQYKAGSKRIALWTA
jgi:hypothetical protein